MSDSYTEWTNLKKNHPNDIVFMKVGKFYELYDQDATVANKEFGLLLMKNQTPHTGFPESTLQKFMDAFQEKGHTVYVK